MNDYQKQAARTLIDCPDFEISDRDIMIIWNAIGLADEVGELQEMITKFRYYGIQPSLFIDEAGDCVWYLAALYTKCDLNMNRVDLSDIHLRNYLSIETAMDDLVVWAGKVCGVVKKGIFHQHGIDFNKLEGYLNSCLRIIGWLCVRFDIDFNEVMAQNIEKLKVRYPNGYSSEDSKKRVDVPDRMEN